MFLKEIEIQGFKSFADKTKVVFERGVTAVVGPNGSGKSNITESLRWALGESSVKNLRGGKMPDVIFAGTESRKPLNYASVVVVLDNSDGFIEQASPEIRVERHIYRSGDSEYKIDGKKVRLRDIHDLFLDTGLGRDSFSIISQGKVEEIFNSKPEERRAIFEEAAGVLKYKTRRKETETKLNQTQDNLDRLEDIIYELDSQVKPLERQAETAHRFLELDGQHKELQLDVLIAQIQGKKELYNQTEQALKEIQESLSSYYQRRNQLEEENQELKAKRQHLQQELDSNQASLLQLTSLVSDLERKIDLQKLEANQAASSRREYQERVSQLESKKDQIQQEIATKLKEKTDLEAGLKDKNQTISLLEKEIADFSEDPDQIIESLREQYVQLMQEEADVSNELTQLENQYQNQLQQAETKESGLLKLRQEVQEKLAEERSALEERDTAVGRVRKLLQTYQEQVQEVSQLTASYKQAQSIMFDVMDKVKAKKARSSSLQAILKNHSNFYAGVKSVLQESSQLGGIIGAVSENLTFSRNYQTALEIALGASSQYIIVEDESAATRAIDFLRKNRAGRATFLPLTTIKARNLSASNRQQIEVSAGFLGLASDLVEYDSRLMNIFHNLLGTTAIFDTVEHAKAAARKVAYQVRIVTLDGTELRTGGSYAGGASKNNNTIFIKPELDALEKEIQQEEEELSHQEEQVSSLKNQLTQAENRLMDIRSEGETARLEEQKAQLAYEQVSKQLTDLQTLLDLQEQEVNHQETGDLPQKKEKMETRLQEITHLKDKLTHDIEQVKSDKDMVVERLRHLNQELSKSQLAKAELASQIQFIATELQRLEQESNQLIQEISDLEQLILAKEHINPEQSVSVLEEQLKTAKEEKDQLNQATIRMKFELEDVDGQAEDIIGHLEQARQQNESLIRKQAKAEAEREQIGEHLRSLSIRLSDNYQMSYDEAKSMAKELENLALAEEELKSLEKSIRALGPVNLDAISQYEEVKSRLDFLNEQRDDVLSAKNLLLSTMQEMNDEVKERFKTTFEAIRESFKQTFTQMFGGGRADLLLTDDDYLTAGVEISVQPPGKKIQSLNLMSGGEKALSALALLFSIIRVKTIPFVILDEVEAALDEANVKRFGDYLNRFDKDSQFIVVTHRKGTMAAADSIYGVTMQESGVSKIVSVKLKDLESE